MATSTTEARRVFNNYPCGWFGERHLWSKEHAKYYQGVQELWDKRKYNPSEMTKKDAQDFIRQIKRSRDPRIATFRDMIAEKLKKYDERYGAMRTA